MHRGFLALVASALLLTACSTSSAAPQAPSLAVGTPLDAAVPHAIASLPLTDSTGRTRHLSDFRGKVVMISDSMTLCQETCPIDTATLLETARDVNTAGKAKDVQFLTITVDPVRDTPHRLAVYRQLYSPAPSNWLTLTGSRRDVAAIWKFFGVYVHKVPDDSPAPKDWLTGKPLTYDIEHSDEVFFLDALGRERFVLDGAPYVGGRADIPKRLYRFMSKEGHRNVNHASNSAWTSEQALRVVGWLDHTKVASTS